MSFDLPKIDKSLAPRIIYLVENDDVPLFRIPIYFKRRKYLALLDTGAGISLISSQILAELSPEVVGKRDTRAVKIKNASGKDMPVLGNFYLNFRIKGMNVKHLFIVTNEISEAVILGIDFITKYKVNFDGHKRQITYNIKGKSEKLIANIAVKLKPERNPIQVKVSQLDNKQSVQLKALLTKHADIFAEKMSDLGRAKNYVHEIRTEGPPIRFRPHRGIPTLRPVIKEHIDELLKCGIIRKSKSPYGARIVMVRKKDNSWRVCIDYRALNKVTQVDNFPLPLIADCLDMLHGARYFSALDCLSGYHQLPIREEDKHKTAFTTPFGHYEYNYMPMGLSSAPASYQRMMNTIFEDTNYKYTNCYLDDLVVFSKDFETHLEHLENVFNKFREEGLKLKLSKCHFAKEEVEYLGHVVSHRGVKPNSNKIAAVKDYPRPKSVGEMRALLGLFSYYRRFVKDFAAIAHPLTKLTRKNAIWKWGKKQEKAFQELKNRLITAPILSFPDFERSFIIHCDASKWGVGSVLAQIRQIENNGKIEEAEVVIAYTSKHLSERESKWSTTEKEAYAIIHAVRMFYPYLYGRPFKVYTDHKPLEWLMNVQDPTGKLARWWLELQKFQIEIAYRPGKKNQNADCLSRIPLPQNENVTEKGAQIAFVIQEWESSQERDDNIKNLEIVTAVGESDEGKAACDESKKETRRKETQVTGKCQKLVNGLKTTVDGKILVPEDKRGEVLDRYHNSFYAGHLGYNKTLKRITDLFYWDTMRADIKNHCKNCLSCAKRKQYGRHRAPLKPMPIATEVWQRLATDIMGPICPISRNNHRYILVVTDYASRMVFTYAMEDQTAETVAEKLKKLFLREGAPQELLSDQGSNYRSQLVQSLVSQLGIKQLQTAAYNPKANGLAESENKILANMIACCIKETQQDWADCLPFITYAYNTSIHSTTNEIPFYIYHGRDARDPDSIRPPVRNRIVYDFLGMFSNNWHEARKIAAESIEKRQRSQKKFYDVGTKVVNIEVGAQVLLRDLTCTPGKFRMRWKGPFIVKKKLSDKTYVITKPGEIIGTTVSIDRLKKFKDAVGAKHDIDDNLAPQRQLDGDGGINDLENLVPEQVEEGVSGAAAREKTELNSGRKPQTVGTESMPDSPRLSKEHRSKASEGRNKSEKERHDSKYSFRTKIRKPARFLD
jgi:transposase InsO family protein